MTVQSTSSSLLISAVFVASAAAGGLISVGVSSGVVPPDVAGTIVNATGQFLVNASGTQLAPAQPVGLLNSAAASLVNASGASLLTGISAPGPVVTLPTIVASGQSNQVGQSNDSTTWPGADSHVTFYDDNDPVGGEVPAGPTPMTALAPRNSGMFGAELALANALVGTPAKNVYYVKSAVNGSSIAQWLTGGVYHAALMAAIDRAVAFGNPKMGFSWNHGEADAAAELTTPTYQSKLAQLMSEVRARAGAGVNVRAFIWRLNVHVSVGYSALIAAQNAFVAADSNAEIINTDARTPNAGIHWGTNQWLLVGADAAPQFAAYFA